MELTIDDCLAIAGRECATEHELRAAVCVAVGQALHYRYEARGYSDAAETAKRDADRARAEARAYSEALIAKDSAPDTSDGLDYPARAEVWKLRESVDALRARAERAEAARDAALALATYEARTTPPTLAQREAHQAAGGAWLVVRIDSNGKIHSDVLIGWSGWQWERVIFVALGADRLPCAWPVVP